MSSYPRSSSLKILKVSNGRLLIRKTSVKINRYIFKMEALVTLWFSYIVLKYKEKLELILDAVVL